MEAKSGTVTVWDFLISYSGLENCTFKMTSYTLKYLTNLHGFCLINGPKNGLTNVCVEDIEIFYIWFGVHMAGIGTDHAIHQPSQWQDA